MKTLRIGTDCSGIEAPIQALKKMKIKYSHEWSCEIDKHAQASIKANYNPKILYDDITKRQVSKLPDIDIYVCGFPCQTFSMAGKRQGFEDTRGTVFFYCVKVIRKKRPNVFILENVKGLLSHDNGNSWKTVLSTLNKLKDYNIYYKVLNTRHYGIPQNRERIFIIGIKKTSMRQGQVFEFPTKKKMKDVRSYIDTKDTSKDNLTQRLKEPVKKSKGVFVDLGFICFNNYNNKRFQTYTPTILRQSALWCVPMKRKANVKEYLSLQGFPKSFKQVVSDRQLIMQVGNSMSVNVLVQLFKCVFKVIY